MDKKREIMEENILNKWKFTIQLQTKKGVDFIFSAVIVWLIYAIIWSLNIPIYTKSIATFMGGGVLFPLAWGCSKILKTNWTIKNNPLQSLGMWFNLGQLFYFPFLIFMLFRQPQYFIMAYAIIAGGHLSLYAWLYDEIGYVVAAIVIPVGALVIALCVNGEHMFYVPLFTSIVFLLFVIWLIMRCKKYNKEQHSRK